MLTVQRALQDGTHTLQQLEDVLSIKAKRHVKWPNLVQLKYNQIESPFASRFVQECRGLILDEERDWYVVARPFDKFFNIEEGHAAKVDWASAHVHEKLDGSLIIMYHYNGAWQVASSGLPDAGGEVNGMNIKFADLFWRTFHDAHYRVPGHEWVDYTFMFELCTPYNRVVVNHMRSFVTLIGIRHRSGVEIPVTRAEAMYPVVRKYDLRNLEQIAATFPDMDPMQQEGYVVVDSKFNRVKVKSPRYVAIHHAIDGMGPKRALEIIRNGESEEVLSKFPAWREHIESIRQRYNTFLTDIGTQYELIKDIPNQKDFAACAVKTCCSDAMFKLRAKRVTSAKEYVRDHMRTEQLADLLQLDNGTFVSPC